MSSEDHASSSTTGDVFALVGRTLHERVRVDRVVAEGGFGVVYAGEHLSLGVPVAVKVLKSDDGELTPPKAFAEQFVREARVIARVRHPNIVQVLDVATVDVAGGVVPYMVLEWCDGVTLDRWLDQRGDDRAMTPQEAWSLLRPVADAIATAHDAGVAHRDLKPTNIMVVASKKGPVAKVLDFGIAKLMNGETAGTGVTATQSSVRAYSPLYAAPEQVAGTRTGPWTDVHALALIFVELVLGATAYKSDSRQWLLQEIMSNVRPTVVHHGLSLGTMDPVIERALAFVPEKRFGSAGELVASMDAVLAQPGVPTVKGAAASRKLRSPVDPTIDAVVTSASADSVTPRVGTQKQEPAGGSVADTISPVRTEQPKRTQSRASLAALVSALALALGVTVVSLSSRSSTANPPTPDRGPNPLVAVSADASAVPMVEPQDSGASVALDLSDASSLPLTERDAQNPDARGSRRTTAPRSSRPAGGGYVLE